MSELRKLLEAAIRREKQKEENKLGNDFLVARNCIIQTLRDEDFKPNQKISIPRKYYRALAQKLENWAKCEGITITFCEYSQEKQHVQVALT